MKLKHIIYVNNCTQLKTEILRKNHLKNRRKSLFFLTNLNKIVLYKQPKNSFVNTEVNIKKTRQIQYRLHQINSDIIKEFQKNLKFILNENFDPEIILIYLEIEVISIIEIETRELCKL